MELLIGIWQFMLEHYDYNKLFLNKFILYVLIILVL